MRRANTVWGRISAAVAVAWLIAPGAQAKPQTVAPAVEIRRTADGIPHIRATRWRDLGLGVGYAQAEDALCTMADGFVTFSGQRSQYFGAEAKPLTNSTFGRSRNLDLDTFFLANADDAVVARYRREHPPELNAMIDGFAEGYNRYLDQARKARADANTPACVAAPWVRHISAQDIYRRMYAAQIAAGYARFIPDMAKAAPPVQEAVGRREGDGTPPQALQALQDRLAIPIGDQAGLGSNAVAFGGAVTGGQGGVLLGNPHWYWGGPDRFYQMHLTLPGKLDVAGVAFLGIPVVMIGFNADIAWSHTVSAARRFGVFDLKLDPQDPTRYLVDNVPVAMEARNVTIDVRGNDGVVRPVHRMSYRTRFGLVLDLGAHHPAFGWGRAHALAIRDVNADNYRIFSQFFAWNRARSLDAFMQIQRRMVAAPWVNTIAIGRRDNRVWYADMGAMPNTPDDLRARCGTALSKGFAAVDPLTPVLDGSQSACDWKADAGAVQAGAMPASAMPSLIRDDYVANMNDSYWLTNPAQPLEGFPLSMGGERQALSLRSREGYRIAADIGGQSPHSSRDVARALMDRALAPRALSADLFKQALLARACVDASLVQPCEVLRRWPNTADSAQRGALLWNAFWRRLAKPPMQGFYQVPFSPADPLHTPRDPVAATSGQQAADALKAAVRDLAAQGLAPDAVLGAAQFVRSAGKDVPIFGGCQEMGYFAVQCNADDSLRMGPQSQGNSYLQVVRFARDGVTAHTLLAHGQRDTAIDSGAGDAPVNRYARKDWLVFPFRDADIRRDPQLRRTVLQR
ncbi:penicillin acylase family protein [Cupriavidus sp. SW-Y-13]|uniref:penicillin acylase family protein n=1 Tax=Cupriavidus sp. SW-Y-13 TaxID=2653854 RepID=UPI0013658BF5|nr:penicillin acylase family protein [Cupriavidus sp. SW-Y-13]MWL86908.1 penicillin acylase family protein [Cupriavidus sp. SW-Y-13]